MLKQSKLLVKKGLKFVPATGRAYNMIPEILKEIDAYDQEGEYSNFVLMGH